MTQAAAPAPSPPGIAADLQTPRWAVALVAVLIVVAGSLAYGNSFGGPFVFDDTLSIPENPAVRSLEALRGGAARSGTSTLSGRPVVGLTFALNYALGGRDVRGYHVANLMIHLLAALALFGVVRRTLSSPRMRERYGSAALPLAGTIALLWTVHPLQTESVTYIVQRTESLASLWYLLTLYAALRGATSGNAGAWQCASLAACLLGMASKEILAAAPLVVLLFDRTFLAGSFREALKERSAYYLGLAASWAVLAALVVSTDGRGDTAGFGAGVAARDYALTQLVAIPHYLRLVLWPAPLVFDYGEWIAQNWREAASHAPIVLTLLAFTALALRRHPAVGFLGAFFFAVLAPSSSFIPVQTQTIAEHRMYLPLAAVLTLLAVGAWAAWQRLRPRQGSGPRAAAPLLCLVAATALVLAALTFARNRDYRTSRALWQDTVEKRPENWRAHYNLGCIISEAGDDAAAFTYLETSFRLKPDHVDTRLKLASLLVAAGRTAAAAAHYEGVLAIEPDAWQVRSNLGLLLAQQGRSAAAIPHFERVLQLVPADAKTRYNLGKALIAAGRLAAGIEQLQEAVRHPMTPVLAYKSLADAFYAAGRLTEAAALYELVLEAAKRDGNTRLAGELVQRLAELRAAQGGAGTPRTD